MTNKGKIRKWISRALSKTPFFRLVPFSEESTQLAPSPSTVLSPCCAQRTSRSPSLPPHSIHRPISPSRLGLRLAPCLVRFLALSSTS